MAKRRVTGKRLDINVILDGKCVWPLSGTEIMAAEVRVDYVYADGQQWSGTWGLKPDGKLLWEESPTPSPCKECGGFYGAHYIGCSSDEALAACRGLLADFVRHFPAPPSILEQRELARARHEKITGLKASKRGRRA